MIFSKKYFAFVKRTARFFAGSMMLGVAFLASCGGSLSVSEGDSGEEIKMRHANLLKISEDKGFTEVTVKNPWDTLKILQKYILIPSDSVLPAQLPKGTIIRTPVTNALVLSTVHTGLLKELGADDAIGGICSVEYVNDSTLKKRLAEGSIIDCGLSQNPDIEKIISLRPQVIMLSPYENNDNYAKTASLGIPIIECADYMESSPLGRAEWMRFYGLLFGVSNRSETLFADIEDKYTQLKDTAATVERKPSVIFDRRYGQVWNVPCGNSTTGQLIEDAGGRNPFASYSKSGSVALSPEKVVATAHDADVWFVRYNQEKEKSLKELASDAPENSQFKAFKEGNVFGCNTQYVNLFEETPFHPERVLRDMVILMHPGLIKDQEPIYYKKMK
ncbi:MAG: ABC transporter substrate-binding protein [Muribaculaceae bacterium]|nr:ABC transporter substrate-binding protein [Muribaculaceae bacterium]